MDLFLLCIILSWYAIQDFKSKVKMIKDLWTMFCGESSCPDADGQPCNFDFLLFIQPNSCINQAFFTCFDILLLVILSFNLIQKSSSKRLHIPAHFQRFTPMQIVAAVVNGSLGLVYIGLGIWILEEMLRKTQTALPLNWWLLALIQGVTWLVVSLTISLRGGHRSPMRLLSTLTFLFSAIVSVLSIFAATLSKEISIKIALDVISLPGALLLICTYKGNKYELRDAKISQSGLYDPLNSEANGTGDIDSVGQVSQFSEAGFFSKLSFWWLNPLMKRGWEKTLRDEDIPSLRKTESRKLLSPILRSVERAETNRTIISTINFEGYNDVPLERDFDFRVLCFAKDSHCLCWSFAT